MVRGRLFAGIAFHQASQSYAAISDFSAPFEVFDDEGEPLHPNQSEDPLEPTTERSAIELIEPGSWRTVDGCVIIHSVVLQSTETSLLRCLS